MEMLTGSLPQTRQTWRPKPVRELFAEIVEANPNAHEDVLRRRFAEAAKADEEYLAAIIDYAFDSACRAAYEKRTRSTGRRRAAALQSHTDLVGSIKEQLLSLPMPNGKAAKDCTLDYMYRLGGKYRAIGVVDSQKLVGAAYDEEGYRKKLQGVL